MPRISIIESYILMTRDRFLSVLGIMNSMNRNDHSFRATSTEVKEAFDNLENQGKVINDGDGEYHLT